MPGYNPILKELEFQKDVAGHINTEVDYGTNLAGNLKWQSGALADDGKIYCAPYASTGTLIIDTNTNEVKIDTFGINTGTNATKYLGSCKGADGKIYGTPYAATDIYIIDPKTQTAEVKTYGLNLTDAAKFSNGALAPNGKIYVPPMNSTTALVIDTINQTAERTNFGLSFSGTNLFTDAITGADGKVYFIPYSYPHIVVVDPETNTATINDFGLNMSDASKFQRSVLASDGKIYCSASSSPTFLIIDTVNQTAERTDFGNTALSNLSLISAEEGSDGNIYFGGWAHSTMVVLNPKSRTLSSIDMQESGYRWLESRSANGTIYFIPRDSLTVGMIDTNPRSKDYQRFYRNTCYHNLGGGTSTSPLKWFGSVQDYQGKIYGVPYDQNSVLIIDTKKNISYTNTYGGIITTATNKHGSGALGTDGKVYMVPHGENRFLVIDPETDTAEYTDLNAKINAQQTGQILVNGDVQNSGTLSGWNTYGSPFLRYGYTMSQTAYYYIWQTFDLSVYNLDLIDNGLLEYYASWGQAGYSGDSDSGLFDMRWFDGNGVEISRHNLGWKNISSTYVKYSMSRNIPPNARTLVVYFIGDRNGGTDNNGHGNDFYVNLYAQENAVQLYGDMRADITEVTDLPVTLNDNWWGSIQYDGKIYCAPYNSRFINIIDCKTQQCTLNSFATDLSSIGALAYSWVVKTKENKLMFIPYSATSFMILDPETGELEFNDYGLDLSGSYKFMGAVLGLDGRIYCIPSFYQNFVVIDTSVGVAEASLLGLSTLPTYAFGGYNICSSGRIYLTPNIVGDLVELDTENGVAKYSGKAPMSASITYKYFGGNLAENGTTYAIPSRMQNVLRLKPSYSPKISKALIYNPMNQGF